MAEKSKFEKRKSHVVSEFQASLRVGDVDENLISILEYINSRDGFYTTSSCSGRIVLFQDLGSKKLNEFIGKWHRKVGFDEVRSSLKKCRGIVWFRYEPTIFHIVAKDLKGARKILELGLKSGFKRSGVHGLNEERYIIEICSTEKIDAPIMENGRLLVSEPYIGYLVKMANKKFQDGEKKLKTFESMLRQM